MFNAQQKATKDEAVEDPSPLWRREKRVVGKRKTKSGCWDFQQFLNLNIC